MKRKTSKKLKRILIPSIFCLGIIWLYTINSIFTLPDVSHLRVMPPEHTSFMESYNNSSKIEYVWIDYKNISPYLKKAVVLAEDDQFWNHGGFVWDAIKAAAKRNWKRKSFSYGASTITQQLARNLFLSPSKNPFRKFKELLIALKLERELSKERILELYLNVAEWGNGIYGAQAASRHYFGASASSLGPNQAAFLAAILPNPRFYDKHRNGSYLQSRISSIENRL